MMKKERTAAQFFDDAVTHGLWPVAFNEDKLVKGGEGLEFGTERNHTRMLFLLG